MPTHPISLYGEYETGWKIIPQFPHYEVNEYCNVRNRKKTTEQILKPNKDAQIKLCNRGKKTMKKIYHLVLLAFFPHIQPQQTVDHIDEKNKNHFIENLQWETSSGNIRKSLLLRPRNNGPARSKPILQWSLDGLTQIAEFTSASEAARQTSINQGNISSAARGNRPNAGGFRWTFKELESQQNMLGKRKYEEIS